MAILNLLLIVQVEGIRTNFKHNFKKILFCFKAIRNIMAIFLSYSLEELVTYSTLFTHLIRHLTHQILAQFKDF